MTKIVLFLFFLAAYTCIEDAGVYTDNGIAIEGYDPVSYFEHKPVKGNIQYKEIHEDNIYYFATTHNALKFINNPEKFLPQYGGYCAYAMAIDGSKVSINPKSYEIRDDKLYLFYSNWLSNTLKKWNNQEPKKLVQQADENWKKLNNK